MKDENQIIVDYINQTVPEVRRESFLKKYQTCLASGYTSEAAFEGAALATYHPATVTKEVETLRQLLLNTLEKANKEKFIERNGVLRTREAIKRWNARMNAVSKDVVVRVGNRFLKVDESEYDAQKYNMPATMKEERYEAVASTESKGELGCIVRTFGNR